VTSLDPTEETAHSRDSGPAEAAAVQRLHELTRNELRVSTKGQGMLSSRTRKPLGAAVLIGLLGVVAALLIAPAAESTKQADRGTLTARNSEYGRILFDGRGFVLYGFTADRKRRSVCSGACATAWPPYLVSSVPRASSGVRKSLLGTIRRADGRRQVTYAGRPLYYYVGDRRPGQILCQDVFEFGGDWLVVRPSGAFVR
jgi:predicted lipoprotein with Yx(FWY)xxD motif